MLFLFLIINTLFGVTCSGVFMIRPHTRHFLCVCMCEFDLRVPHFLMLSSSAHYPNSGWTRSKVRAVRRWPTFSFCQRPSFSYPPSALSQVHPACSSYKIRRKMWRSHRCIVFKRVIADGIRYSELFSFFFF